MSKPSTKRSKEAKKRSKAAKRGWETRRFNAGRKKLSEFLEEKGEKAKVPEELQKFDSTLYRIMRMYMRDITTRTFLGMDILK